VNQDRTNANDLGSVVRSLQCISQKCRAKSDALRSSVHGEPRKKDHWNGMARETFAHALRSVRVFDLRGGETVVADD
jgi:hypothetical protein